MPKEERPINKNHMSFATAKDPKVTGVKARRAKGG
jgi:hypothetical protein